MDNILLITPNEGLSEQHIRELRASNIPVEAFESNNLIFVDEGHKGSGGEAWRSVRDALGETGFTFEYSATFGQALTAAGKSDLTVEYGKAIAVDYSYRHFYKDGYGKDFHILNLKEETTPEQTDTLLLANLLSFYEQKRVVIEEDSFSRSLFIVSLPKRTSSFAKAKIQPI